MTTEVSSRPWLVSAIDPRVDHGVDIGAEAAGVDPGSVSRRLIEDGAGHELPGGDWTQFGHGRAVPGDGHGLSFLHGTEDPRVHPSQSLELYRHLQVLGQAPVRLVFYPGEGHGNRRSAARLDYALRTLRWMEHYLKGPAGDAPNAEIDYARHLPWPVGEESENDGKTRTDAGSGATTSR